MQIRAASTERKKRGDTREKERGTVHLADKDKETKYREIISHVVN